MNDQVVDRSDIVMNNPTNNQTDPTNLYNENRKDGQHMMIPFSPPDSEEDLSDQEHDQLIPTAGFRYGDGLPVRRDSGTLSVWDDDQCLLLSISDAMDTNGRGFFQHTLR